MSAPRPSRSSAHSPSSWSPSTTRPCRSTTTRRSASPSSAKPRSAPRAITCSARSAGAVAPQPTLMFSPSGSLWITSTLAPVAARSSGAVTPPEPCAQSSTMRRRHGVARARPSRSARYRSTREASWTMRPIPPLRGPPSSSVRQMSCSSRSSTASSSLRPRPSSTLSPLSSAGLWDAETMIPAAKEPVPARNARAGVGSTPASWTSAPRLAAPAAIAATNICPDRRVSRPTTRLPPAPTSSWAVALPSA